MLSTGGRLRRFLVVAWWAVAGIGRVAVAAPATEADLAAIARRSVLRLDVERKGTAGAIPGREKLTARGSAVIVSAEPPENPRVLVVATAYHVLIRALNVSVYAHSDERPIAMLVGNSRCFVDRSRELAFLEVKLDVAPPELGRIDMSGPGPRADGQGKVPGMAFGYARFHTLALESSQVNFWGLLDAGTLGIVRETVKGLTGDDIWPQDMRFRLLGNQATLEGMSGGLGRRSRSGLRRAYLRSAARPVQSGHPRQRSPPRLGAARDPQRSRLDDSDARPFKLPGFYEGGGEAESEVEIGSSGGRSRA